MGITERLFNRLMVGVVVLGFLGLMAMGAAAGFVVVQNQAFAGWVAHTYEVEQGLSGFRLAVERTETARRGYLLDQDPIFYRTFRDIEASLPVLLDRVGNLTTDNPSQQRSVAQARALVAHLMRGMDDSVGRVRSGKLAEARASFTTDDTVRGLRQLRSLTEAMAAEEQGLLKTRNQAQQASAQTLYRVLAGGGALLAIVALSSLWVILRHTRDRAASRNALSVMNLGLESAVQERTADFQRANARLETMLREVNHRVANSLQLVSAFVQMQAGALDDAAAREALAGAQRRIAAIMQVHRKLYTSDDVEAVEMQGYLTTLLRELEDAWSTPESPRRLTLDAESLRLHTDKAVSVGVIVNELVTNACKYAYAPDQHGEIRVALRRDGPRDLILLVEDDGVGMEGSARGTGLGGKILGAMAASLKSQLKYDNAGPGVRASLRIVV